jgi:hypothetical protein
MTRLATIAAVALVGTANAFTREFSSTSLESSGEFDTLHIIQLFIIDAD